MYAVKIEANLAPQRSFAWSQFMPYDVCDTNFHGALRMNLYAILRRDGFADGPTLEAAAARSTKIGDDMANDIRWIRSYVLAENEGNLGTVCIYQASSEEAIRKHAAAADLPVTEIIPIADTVLVRPDPE
jgi:hypothetical protein